MIILILTQSPFFAAFLAPAFPPHPLDTCMRHNALLDSLIVSHNMDAYSIKYRH